MIDPPAIDVGLHTMIAKERRRQQMLDMCLNSLEDAFEGGLTTVPRELAARISPIVPGVQGGRPIKEAIDLVFKEQAMCLDDRDRDAKELGVLPLIERNEARTLTDQIKRGLDDAYLLMLKAHDLGAWGALGYKSWEGYVRREFGLGRSRSYQLLDHARAVQALMSAARTTAVPRVHPYATSQIKTVLAEVTMTVARRTTQVTSAKMAEEVIVSVVDEFRTKLARSRQTDSVDVARNRINRGATPDRSRQRLAYEDRFWEAIDTILNPPDDYTAYQHQRVGARDLARLRVAATRLDAMVAAIDRQSVAKSGSALQLVASGG